MVTRAAAIHEWRTQVSTAFQVLLGFATTFYCLYSFAHQRRRRSSSWASLVARLRPDWTASELYGLSSTGHASRAAVIEKCKRICRARGLWTAFQNTGVMLEMADYAARDSSRIDPEILAALRSDALQIRLAILTIALQYARGAAAERIGVTMLRVQAAFAEMELGLTELLQQNAPQGLPDFVAAI